MAEELTGMQNLMKYLIPVWWLGLILVIAAFFAFAMARAPIGFILVMFSYIVLIAFAFFIWIYEIIDCAQREFPGENDKVVWILLLVFLGMLGATIYYYIHGNRPR